jgi:hypothetical protein
MLHVVKIAPRTEFTHITAVNSPAQIFLNFHALYLLLPQLSNNCRYHEAYEYYKKAQASYWTVEEVDLSQDMRDWAVLTPEERHFISYVLAFFAASDGIVLENLAVRFMQGKMQTLYSDVW